MASTGGSARIVAVAVTFDRAEMVSRLVRAASSGTVRPDEIVVVDNASRDDTVSVLEQLADELAVPLRVVRLATNTGGAGGFHAGLEDFLAGGADLVWLMDDDGVPAPDCLQVTTPSPSAITTCVGTGERRWCRTFVRIWNHASLRGGLRSLLPETLCCVS